MEIKYQGENVAVLVCGLSAYRSDKGHPVARISLNMYSQMAAPLQIKINAWFVVRKNKTGKVPLRLAGVNTVAVEYASFRESFLRRIMLPSVAYFSHIIT